MADKRPEISNRCPSCDLPTAYVSKTLRKFFREADAPAELFLAIVGIGLGLTTVRVVEVAPNGKLVVDLEDEVITSRMIELIMNAKKIIGQIEKEPN